MERRLLGGSWVVISRVLSRVTILITHIRGLLTPLITTHEPPSIMTFSWNPYRTLYRTSEHPLFNSAEPVKDLQQHKRTPIEPYKPVYTTLSP